MAGTETNEAKISIKVIVDKVNERVVYAEADYTFVDILFSFMTLPMGTIVRILGKHDDKKFEALGSLNNLYQSLKIFPECYFSTEECKSLLLNPKSLSYDHCKILKLKIDDTEPMYYYGCGSCMSHKFLLLRSRNDFMGSDYSDKVPIGVFVSTIGNFIITDDLYVKPFSSADSIRLLAESGISDMNQIEERNLEMSSSQMVYFLNLALTTKCPFTCLVFSKFHSSDLLACGLVGCGQDNTFDLPCDLMKKEVSASSKMLVEVTRQKSTKKLLFAETKEDFVEFLFGILSIPLGTVFGTLMNGASSVGCMNNILISISNMTVGSYIKSQDIKDLLLKPHFGQEYSSKHQIFPLNVIPTPSKHHHKDRMLDERYLNQSGLFIVTDDLTINPSSSFSIIDILRKSKVSPEDIERCEVSIGLEEGLRILKASLKSCRTLTRSLMNQLKT